MTAQPIVSAFIVQVPVAVHSSILLLRIRRSSNAYRDPASDYGHVWHTDVPHARIRKDAAHAIHFLHPWRSFAGYIASAIPAISIARWAGEMIHLSPVDIVRNHAAIA